MVKINKDLRQIPGSLNSERTIQRLNEIIENNRYIYESRYDKRYKQQDIKTALELIYYKKCAYCEKDVGDSFYHIEHYRPKKEYYWLDYSWDNLLICCDKCNIYKKTAFEVDGEKAVFSTPVTLTETVQT